MKKILLIIFSITSFYAITIASAADFFTAASKSQVLENENVDVYLYVNSDGLAINGAEGTVSFPSDLLSVVSVSTAGSIFPIWVEQPTYSSANGTVSFNGGVPNPGFSGSKGTAVKVTFKAKKAGSAAISFVSGSIYSNDGLGTDVVKRKGGTTITVKAAEAVPAPVAAKEEKTVPADSAVKKDEIVQSINTKNVSLPPIPNVSSTDLKDGSEWFTTKNLTLDWDVPSGVTAVQFSFGGKEDALPTSVYSPAINSTKLINVASGVSYFHIRFKNAAGWGEVLHKQIKVDAFPPGPITGSSDVTSENLISLTVKSTDIHSGIEKYEVYANGKKIAESAAEANADTVIALPLLKSGVNNLTIIAYDYAKNTATKTIEVNSPEPEAPQIQISKTETLVNEENSLLVKTYPSSEVLLYVQDENGAVSTSSAKTDSDGMLKIPVDAFKTPGTKKVWVSLNNDCANICVLSEQITVQVAERGLVRVPKALLQMVQNQSDSTLPWIIAFVLLVLYLMTFKRKYANKDIIQELNKAEIDVYKTFKVLKADAKKYKAMLKRNKVDISEKDQVIMEDLEKDLDEAETYFAKRIEKIEREL